MRNVLVNALGVTNQSGRSVLTSHLEALVSALGGGCRFHVLARHEDALGFRDVFGDRVSWRFAPASTDRWLYRSCWEWRHLPRLASECGADLYFTPSGMAARRLAPVQVVFCMNPWALVRAARCHRDALKAWLQRMAYRYTVKRAEALVFLSPFMQDAYEANAGYAARRAVIACQPAGEAKDWDAGSAPARVPGRVLCVSAMAPHKNIETLLRAFYRVCHVPDAEVHLVGGWPDARYEARIRRLANALGIDRRVIFAGCVSRKALWRHYAEAQVFCLMSRCESFGIPAVEAQSAGTPVVVSNVCAVPEVCGEGGIYCDPDDVDATARALEALLTDATVWSRLSAAAMRNAARYTVDACTRPLIHLFEDMLSLEDEQA